MSYRNLELFAAKSYSETVSHVSEYEHYKPSNSNGHAVFQTMDYPLA